MKKVSLKDIAESLGVSKALVSLVLNGKGDERGISRITQEKVKKKALELNYIPNQYARGLRIGRTNTIGIIVPDISNVFYGKLCKAIEIRAYEKGYNLIISNSYENINKEKKLTTDLINRNIDGLILASSFDNKSELVALKEMGVPLVLVDRVFADLDVDSVSVSNKEGAEKATQYLVDKKVKNPACMTISPIYISSISERMDGYRSVLESVGKAPIFYEIPHDQIEEGVTKALEEIQTSDVDGVFCVNNSIAKSMLKAFNAQPDAYRDLRIISFDDIEVFDLANPKISSVAQPIESIGKNAIDLLIDRLEKKDAHLIEQKVLETKLIER